MLARAGRSKEAIAQYTEAIRLSPTSALAHQNLAIALAGEGRLDEALQECLESLRLDASHADWHVRRRRCSIVSETTGARARTSRRPSGSTRGTRRRAARSGSFATGRNRRRLDARADPGRLRLRPQSSPSVRLAASAEPSHGTDRNGGAASLLIAFLLLVFGAQAASSIATKSATWDETNYFGMGDYLLRHRQWDVPSAVIHPPLAYYLRQPPVLFADSGPSRLGLPAGHPQRPGISRGLDTDRGQALPSSPQTWTTGC